MNVLLVIILIVTFIVGYHCLTNQVDINNYRTSKTTTTKHYNETGAGVPGLCPGCVHTIKTDAAYCSGEKETTAANNTTTTTTTTVISDFNSEEYL